MPTSRTRSVFKVLLAIALGLLPPLAKAHEPRPETLAAFNLYRDRTAARMHSDLLEGHFLYIDRFPRPLRALVGAQLHRGEFYLEQLRTLDGDRKIAVPGGIIHHWIGLAFIPGVTLTQTKSVLEDYARQKENYFPDVRQSKLLSQDGNVSEVFLQFYSKTIVTAVFNVNFSSVSTDYSPTRTQIRSCSSRVAEVDNFGKPDEHELAPADSHGYMWQLCTWWGIDETDGGTYIQVEAIELSRTVPFAFAWLINPIIRNVPKTFLSHLLSATRKAATAKSLPHTHGEASSSPNSTGAWPPPSAGTPRQIRLSTGIIPDFYRDPAETFKSYSQPCSAICSSIWRASKLPFFEAATSSTRA